ncbi:5'-nucleotidase C-terminal domain-containing protein [Yimella radicis]
MSDKLQTTRRQMLGMAVVGGAGLFAASAPSAQAKPNGARLTVLGTTDLHGNIFNWDYFKNAEYDDRTHNDIGAAKCSTLIKAMRQERGADSCITLDAGDTIQGTPLAYYYAKIDPITKGSTHPMALAMNEIGYDAAAMGNHEFNYGLDTLDEFRRQVNFPMLCANALDWNTRRPVYPSYVIKTVKLKGHKPIRVGIVGLVTPGVSIWDKAIVDGKLRFNGIVEQAEVVIPQVKRAGADVVIVSAHSGADTSSSWGDALPYLENASSVLAEEVPDIDAILVGHAHKEIPQRYVTNKATGKQVLLSEPLYWGMRVTVMDLDLVKVRGQWQVQSSSATLLNADTVPEDPKVAALVHPAHQKVLAYVNGVIGTSKVAMSAATSRYEDTPAIDFINYVQAKAVQDALVGTPYMNLPVLSIAAPFNKAAAIPAGEVTVRDVAGLYIFDNTVMAITLTGRQIRAYLETSAQYFKQVSGTGPFTADQVTNASTPQAPSGTPDYNYDIMAGLDERLTYDIDIASAPGNRIRNLEYGAEPLVDEATFVIAINNYRASGGGSFPGVTTAPVIYNQQVEIRQLLIDWVTANKVIDPALFASDDWRLVSGSTAITVTEQQRFSVSRRGPIGR